MRTSDFDYQLPAELIAQVPTAERGASRLLGLNRAEDAEPTDLHFGDLPELLGPGDVLVLNSTKVRHARLVGLRPSGAPAEVLLIHPASDGTWIAMGKPGSAFREQKRIMLGDGVAVETVQVLDGPHRRVRLLGASAEEAMDRFGRLPLPPYVDREPTRLDDERYQTVYAERESSVAAPTAGLHFTEPLLRRIEERGVAIERLELEVGPGTFRPVEAVDPRQHPMHPEAYTIPDRVARALAGARGSGHGVWAVGTTVVRALESAGRDDGTVEPGTGTTSLLILPGFRFRMVDHLITNFHLPRSTLLMLVCAFAGTERVLEAYRHAVAARYRFYSYGDAMLIR